jgi:hypothetical protein
LSSINGPEPLRAGQSASSRSLFRALAIAAMLLLAALAAGPAYAQDAGGGAPTPPVSDPAAPPPVTDTTPSPPTQTPDSPANTPPAESIPPPSDQPVATDPGAGQSTPATNDSPVDAGHKQPARPSDAFTTTTSGPSSSATSPSSSTAGPSSDLTSSGTGHPDSWLGQDTFVIDKTKATTDHEGLKTVKRRFAGLFLIGASTKATRTEAKARRANETAKVSAIGSGGPPTPGNPLPRENPFFNLLSGPSGIAASLMLASMLAVLGAAFVLPRDRLRAFRTPTVTWSPLAYVPPIELPG